MEFFKGVLTVMILYAVAWGIFQVGYMFGAETEKTFTVMAQNRLQNCHDVITRNN